MKLNTKQTQILDTFLSEAKKELIIISDFDGTLVNEYTYDPLQKSHTPLLKKQLIQIIEKLKKKNIKLFLCTARTSEDPDLPMLRRLVGETIVAENGGVLFDTQENKYVLLSTNKQQSLLTSKKIIHGHEAYLKDYFHKKGYELVIRLTRISDIEFRIQYANGKGLTDTENSLYDELWNLLQTLPIDLGLFEHIRTGGSIVIKPPHITKSNGVQKLFEKNAIDKHTVSTIALGDNDNDKDLYTFADLSINVGEKNLPDVDINLHYNNVGSLAILTYILNNYA